MVFRHNSRFCYAELTSPLGPVFRVSPNELSFASVASWKAIYGHRPADKEAVIKSELYEMYGAGFESLCVGSERNPVKHSQMRRSLSSAFSTKALSEQESIVARNIDSFVLRVGQDGGPSSDGLNMSKWYEMNAFDVLGDMAFGESFHCVETGELFIESGFLREWNLILVLRETAFLARTDC